MPDIELTYFQLLKKEVARQLCRSFPEIQADIEQWKGKEIRHFQEDLIQKVNGRISDTHMKADNGHMPRIDILNLLSQYAGYGNWEDFKSSKGLVNGEQKEKVHIRPYVMWIGLFICLGLLSIFYISSKQPVAYQFCFVNAYNKQPIHDAGLDIIILHENESPYRIQADKNGCMQLNAHEEYVRFIVKGPYYKTDTITRILNKGQPEEQIALKTNDYAWMIRIFSSSSVDDWQKRRAQLDSMITEDARIYQILNKGQIGMEMYNKWEFIDKLTMPIQSLRNIEVLEMQYAGDKIKELRFQQFNPKSHEQDF
jgi:hypothetical protein